MSLHGFDRGPEIRVSADDEGAVVFVREGVRHELDRNGDVGLLFLVADPGGTATVALAVFLLEVADYASHPDVSQGRNIFAVSADRSRDPSRISGEIMDADQRLVRPAYAGRERVEV